MTNNKNNSTETYLINIEYKNIPKFEIWEITINKEKNTNIENIKATYIQNIIEKEQHLLWSILMKILSWAYKKHLLWNILNFKIKKDNNISIFIKEWKKEIKIWEIDSGIIKVNKKTNVNDILNWLLYIYEKDNKILDAMFIELLVWDLSKNDKKDLEKYMLSLYNNFSEILNLTKK